MERDDSKLDLEALFHELRMYENPATEKQADILKAAEALFGEHGFTQTPTASIAKRAGVTEKTLFKHFPTKNALLKRILFPVILRVLVPRQMAHVRDMMSRDYAGLAELIETIAGDRWAFARQHGGKLKLMIGEILYNDELRGKIFAAFSGTILEEGRKTIAKLQEQGKLRSDLPAQDIVRMLVTLMMGYALLRGVIAPKRKWDDAADVRFLVEVLGNGLFPKGK